jgi:hypothetical protein
MISGDWRLAVLVRTMSRIVAVMKRFRAGQLSPADTLNLIDGALLAARSLLTPNEKP